MKTIKWLVSSIVIFGMISCGSGDKKEAKELLQKILQIVGIPYDIVVNICQDGNSNGICDATDLQTKVTLKQGDSFDDIWQKISLTSDGRYFLETMDRTKPILLELQDEAKVNYDSGKFTIPFDGFKNSEQNETKELSILASLVDKGYFSDTDLKDIRSLNNPDTQKKFYRTLLNSLEENINILRTKGLDAQQTMSGNLKEIADELEGDGVKTTLTDDLNRCGIDLVCVDTRLGTLGSKLLITDEEADTIAKEQQGSENQSSNSNSGNGKKLLVSKEIDSSEQNFGETTSSTTITTTYTYNSKNQSEKSIITIVSKYNGSETSRTTNTCTDNYDSQGRYIGNSCIEQTSDQGGANQSNTSRDIINYSGNKIVSNDYYHNGNLSSKWEVTKWDGDRAIEWKSTSYNNEPTQTTVYTSSYTGNNPTHIESTSTYSDTTINYVIDRTFDNKKTPYYWEMQFMNIDNIWWGGWIGENNIIKETSKMTNSDYTYTTRKTNSITYNSSDMPTKIETTITTDGADYVTHTTTTYEYIEAK